MVFRNVPRLHGLVGCGALIAAAAVPIGCGDDEFSGCEASRTCPPEKAGGGEAGGFDTGGASGSGSGRSGSGGASGSDAGGSGGSGDAGAGGSPDGEGGEGGSAPPPDTTAPTIVSVSPEDGVNGVRADADLVITFSEPMDRVSTQAAYQSADIPAGAVTFSWNSDSSVLTVNPNSDLAYADGNDLNVVARSFAAQVTDTAEDEAGNRLASNFDWSFRTLRRITQTFSTGTIHNVRSSDTTLGIPCTSISPLTYVGDRADNVGLHLLITRDISALPEGIVEWEVATLSSNQVESEQSVFDDFGLILTHHVSLLPPTTATWSSSTLRALGQYSNSPAAGARSVNVRDALADDYEHRSERQQTSQYRIGFERTTDGDSVADAVSFNCPSWVLTSQYLIP
jgi:hypothetical protein